ncbi:sensor histidine kinase [Actinophytocola sp. NPDC049390]|uniref:sensor histidine kinase n=1 Tax=Actinophytocola sp. NPDC049390 TaxID=3363894 RepID=UPI0037A6CD49
MFELLRSVWREARPVPTPPPAWWDWALVGVLVPVAVLEGVLRAGLDWRWLSVVVCAGLVFTLPFRRSRPLLVVAIAFGVCGLSPFVVGHAFPQQNVLVYMILLPFALFRWGSGREEVLGAAIIYVKLGIDAVMGFLPFGDALAGFFIVSALMAVGAAVRYRARARHRELDQVKLLERERLARDLHDTVAHHVSAMAIRAQAGIATAAADPDAAVDALRLIDTEAARALDEMRGMVRLLRSDPAALSPGPRVTDLTRLPPPVDVTLTGDVDDLPAPVQSAIYRLAQEAVTNAHRHARHVTRIEVRVDAGDTEVRLSVRDDGDPPGRTNGSGYGLVGMAERTELLGGTCEAGPAPDRGWAVTAVLPRATR